MKIKAPPVVAVQQGSFKKSVAGSFLPPSLLFHSPLDDSHISPKKRKRTFFHFPLKKGGLKMNLGQTATASEQNKTERAILIDHSMRIQEHFPHHRREDFFRARKKISRILWEVFAASTAEAKYGEIPLLFLRSSLLLRYLSNRRPG